MRLVSLKTYIVKFGVLALIAAAVFGGLFAPARAATFQIQLKEVASGLDLPVFLTHAGDGSGRMFVLEKPGRIVILNQDGQELDQPFLDIRSKVGSSGYEQGLLGLAFHPNYEQNGLFFVNYTDRQGDTVIERYRVLQDDANRADPSTAKAILKIDQPFPNHNGGMVAFGPDGYLYIGMGDGGGGGDPLKAGQDTRQLLGKILRLDIDNGDPYAIPADNPFADGKEGAAEVWSYGWRNPWRFSFDRATNDKYIADVGQNAYEEVSFEKAGSPGGLNYGWNTMEASHCFPERAGCNRDGLVLPVAEYGHSLGNSITGGYVYRGNTYPRLQGYYFFADFGSSRLWSLQQANGSWQMEQIAEVGFPVSSFGEDEAGEVYLVDFRGRIHRLTDVGQ